VKVAVTAPAVVVEEATVGVPGAPSWLVAAWGPTTGVDAEETR
jgi:hypothetical protein